MCSVYACFADWSDLQKSLPGDPRALGSHTDGKVSQVQPLMLTKVTLFNGICMFSIFTQTAFIVCVKVEFFGFCPQCSHLKVRTTQTELLLLFLFRSALYSSLTDEC